MTRNNARTNVLFVCSKNRWRSPTAERVYRDDPRLNVRSAGTTNDAVRTIGQSDIQWADVIIVMESKHKQRLQATYPSELRFKSIHVLDIPDDYQFMDAELVEMIRISVDPLLGESD